MKTKSLKVLGIVLQEKPLIYLTTLPGQWLLKHTTPVWRIKDPERGFQRVVKEERARRIAVAVLNEQRAFPNAIVLATNVKSFRKPGNKMTIPGRTRFLVVDGQHRLWAQKFSEFEAQYACVIHMGQTEEEMAKLFLEINDNQKRVPASLRWDLVRLVRPDEDPHAIKTAELIYELTTDDTSPLYQRVDLTGEQKEISLKQGSLAPEIKQIVSSKTSALRKLDFETQCEIIKRYISAIRDLDPDGWKTGETPFYSARVMRALLRLLPKLIESIEDDPGKITAAKYGEVLNHIDPASLDKTKIVAVQGAAGINQIYEQIRAQLPLEK